MADTVILPCDCKNQFQDERYGSGKRVHNVGAGNSPKKTCTVCGKQK